MLRAQMNRFQKLARLIQRCCILSALVVPAVNAQIITQNGGMGELDCVIEPHLVVDLSSRVDGIVESISAERGELVEAGQTLVELDSGVEQAVVAHSRARAQASAEIHAGSVSMAFANRRMGRVETLFKTAVASPDQWDEVSTEADLARLQLQRANENQLLAELELRQSVEVLDRHSIRSPISGVVIQRFLAPGESVKDVPIMRIAQIDPLRVEVIVPVSEFGSIKAGQSAIVHPEAPMQGNYAAMVSIVDRVADAASGTFRVRLSLPNPDLALPSGLKCGVQFLPMNMNSAPKTRIAKTAVPDRPVQRPGSAPRLTADTQRAQCQTVGPINDESQAMNLMKTLKSHSEDIRFRQTQDKLTVGYMLLSPDQGSLAQAKAYAEKVQAAGIKDFQVLPAGGNHGRVSLGYYNQNRKASAEQRQAVLAKAGFNTELSPQKRATSAFWLDLETSDVNAVVTVPALRGINVEAVSCDSMVAARD